MNIEDNPYYSSRKYYGSISIPELINAENTSDIPFSIEICQTFNEDSILEIEYYNIHAIIKKKDFKPFRGKEKKIIYNRIMEEILSNNIKL